MIRRRLLVALGATPLCAWLNRAHAQSVSPINRIGILAGGSRESTRYQFVAFEAGLRELGYVDGKNVVLDYRFADGNSIGCHCLPQKRVRSQPKD